MTQSEQIVKYMQDFGSISPQEAVSELGVYRLAARIHDLSKSGLSIGSKTETYTNRYGKTVHYSRYWLDV